MTGIARGQLRGAGPMLAFDRVTPAGPGGPTLIFLPGGGQTRRSWAAGLRQAARLGLPALALDLRGHGDSDPAPDGRYHLRDMAADTIAVVDAIAGPVILIGASRGGQTCMLAAAARPDRVRAVLLADIAPGTNRQNITAIRAFLQASAAGFASPLAASQALGAYRGQSAPPDPDRLARVLRPLADGRLYWHWDPRFADDAFIDPPDEAPLVDQAAARLRCPVLLVRGSLSELVDDACVAHFRRLTPQVQVELLEGAGHMLTDGQTAVFVDRIFGFLHRNPDILKAPEPAP